MSLSRLGRSRRRSVARDRLFLVLTAVVILGAIASTGAAPGGTSPVLPSLYDRAAAGRPLQGPVRARNSATARPTLSPLRARIVALAESQVGYQTEPANTYCNKFSAYWYSGQHGCGRGELAEQWCADFAAWVWQRAGAVVVYRFAPGDLNSSAASFYEWGKAHATWHPLSSHYVPKPGDVAVYGLDTRDLVADHVAVVVSYTRGQAGPTVVNGDGDLTGFSVVDMRSDEYWADTGAATAPLSGYVSPSGPADVARHRLAKSASGALAPVYLAR